MVDVSDALKQARTPLVSAVLCLDAASFDRFGGLLRHLVVGFVDQAVSLRLVSTDDRAESLAMGPIRLLRHNAARWPFANRRIEQLVESISAEPPTVIHAISNDSYRLAGALADAFDVDLVYTVASLTDCNAITTIGSKRVARFLPVCEPLVTILTEQLGISADRIQLVRPGVMASSHVSCFADPMRTPSIICLAPLERDTGVARLIEAADILNRREHEFMLFLLGRGRREESLRRMIRERKLSACVSLAHPAGRITQAINSADVFVRPSEIPAYSASALQAMAAGVAVVTLPNGISDHLRHNETAVVCEGVTADALAGAIERLVIDRTAARTLATEGAAYARTHHAASSMADRTADVYRELAFSHATFPIKESGRVD